MTPRSVARSAYYTLKPFIPRRVQIALRRRYVAARLPQAGSCWPVDEQSATPPAGWRGWPGGKRFALVLTHDVEGDRGVRRVKALAAIERDLGFRSSFNFVPLRYAVPPSVRAFLAADGFEVGVHDLSHDGRLYSSRKRFERGAATINEYLRSWGAVGFRSASMWHNLAWMHRLRIEYDSSTFDTDPFEPQPDGLGTIFPLWVDGAGPGEGYVELPYTLPQDLTVFVLLRQVDGDLWRRKLAWIADHGGMALVNTHPDYMALDGRKPGVDEYDPRLYGEFLLHVKERYAGQYWDALPRDVARHHRGLLHPDPSA
jgi:hypothetical protein